MSLKTSLLDKVKVEAENQGCEKLVSLIEDLEPQTPKKIINDLIKEYEENGVKELTIPVGCYMQAMANPEQKGEFILVKLVGAEPDYSDWVYLKQDEEDGSYKATKVGEEGGPGRRETLKYNSALVEYWSYSDEAETFTCTDTVVIPKPCLFKSSFGGLILRKNLHGELYFFSEMELTGP